MALIINGERIEDDALRQVGEQLGREAGGGGAPEWERKGITLEDFAERMLVAQVLVRQEALRRYPKVSGKEINQRYKELRGQYESEQAFLTQLRQRGLTPDAVRDDIAMGLRVDALLDEITDATPDPTEEELRRYYEAHRNDFAAPERIHAAHIVKHCGDNVLDVQAAHSMMREALVLLEEGMDFATVARRFSDCPENGGDLGFFARGQMVPEFEQAVFALEEGAISGVFQTPFGLHIATVLERVPAQQQDFDSVRAEVLRTLINAAENDAIDAFTDSLRAQATIERVA